METREALLRRLELKVVRPLDGLLFGDYRGVFYGRSLELSEISPYHPGDELERIDWPATARTGTLHVRRFREEKELTLWLLLDGGATVRFGSRRREKYALGLELALAFAYIALRHGNRVGGVVSGRLLPPRGGKAQALALAEAALEAAEDPAPLGERLDLLGRVARRRGLLFVFSDFLDEFALPLGRLAARHDLVAVLLEDPLERELPEGVWRFRDPKTGEVVEVDALDPKVRAAYRTRAEALRKARLEALRRAGAEVVLASTEMDLVPLILGFVERRRRWPSRSRGPSFWA